MSAGGNRRFYIGLIRPVADSTPNTAPDVSQSKRSPRKPDAQSESDAKSESPPQQEIQIPVPYRPFEVPTDHRSPRTLNPMALSRVRRPRGDTRRTRTPGVASGASLGASRMTVGGEELDGGGGSWNGWSIAHVAEVSPRESQLGPAAPSNCVQERGPSTVPAITVELPVVAPDPPPLWLTSRFPSMPPIAVETTSPAAEEHNVPPCRLATPLLDHGINCR